MKRNRGHGGKLMKKVRNQRYLPWAKGFTITKGMAESNHRSLSVHTARPRFWQLLTLPWRAGYNMGVSAIVPEPISGG
jgi:hypothetical protein